MSKTKKEVSTTGGIAGYQGRISAPGNPTPEEETKKEATSEKDKEQKGKAFRKE